MTVTVVGAQNYGGTPLFAGSTGVSGVTVTGVKCTGLTSGASIDPTLNALGSYTIAGSTCSGGTLSNSNYVISGYRGSTFTVYKAALTVTAQDASRNFGSANPTFDYTITGFQNGEDSSTVSGQPSLTTTATSTSDVGSYPITAAVGTLSSKNYRFVFNNGTLTVNPKPLTVTVTGAQNYGNDPVFAGSMGVSGVTVTGIKCTGLTGGQPIAPTLNVGSYTIDPETCSGGTVSSPNYTIGSYKSGTFSVYKAALTVTAQDASRNFGSANPTFDYTITGFQNGEDSSTVSGQPSLTTTATSTSDVGNYPITAAVGTLSSKNYRFVFNNGTLTVNPKPLTVTVTGAQDYGDDPTFAGKPGSTGVTISGVTCTGLTGGQPIAPTLNVGSYTIDPETCSGGTVSSPNYTIASYKSGTFSVYKAALTVTAQDASRNFGSANPTFDYTITGFQNGEDSSTVSGQPSLTTTATSTSDVGNYPITAAVGTLSSKNYRFVFNNGTLTVNPKPLTVTVIGAQDYGDDPTFAGKPGSTGVTISGVTCTGLTGGQPIAPTLNVGSYTIDPETCSGGTVSSPNYTIASYKSGTFSVYKAALTVTAQDASRNYGSANPTLTYAITGFQNGETASVVSGAPGLSTAATMASDAGTYPIDITAGDLSSSNYRFTLKGGTLTVLKKNLSVKADPATRSYGDPPPVYTATYTGFRNGDTPADLSGAPEFSTTATANSDPGEYPLTIAVGTLASPNYTFVGFAQGSSTLTITQGVADIATVKMASGILKATITYGAEHHPVVGSTITFTIGSTSTVACTAVTDANGLATCTVSGLVRTKISLSGYTAHFPGTTQLLAGEKHQGIT